MKSPTQLLAIILTGAALTAGLWAQSGASPNAAPSKNDSAATQSAVTGADIQALRQGLAAAMEQIQQLKDELHRRDAAVQQAQTTATDAAAKADAAQQQAKQGLQNVNALQGDVAELKNVNLSGLNNATLRNAVMTIQEPTQPAQNQGEVLNTQMESAITLRFRGINITPGGFAAAEFVHRSRALDADVSTPFSNLTMPGASQSQMSEFYGSGRQSKASVFVEGRLKNVDLSSYISTDFLSAGVTSTSTNTNSYTLRLRQAWAQAKFTNGFSFVGGQMWSLVTEDAVGIAPDDDLGKTNDVRPKTIDAAYNVGFNFARQYGIRATKSFGNKVAIAVAMENPEATLAAPINGLSNYILGSAGDGKSYNSSGTYSFNPSPDIIAKIAFDPGFGHYEVFGLFDRFAIRAFPCEDVISSYTCGTSATPGANATDAYNTSKNGGGFGASARWNFWDKRITFGLKGFGGSGVGRYSAGTLSDATVINVGNSSQAIPQLELLKNLSGLTTLEWHGKKLDFYGYGGTEYAGRAWAVDPVTGKAVGYGSPLFPDYGCYTEAAPGSGGFSPTALSNCAGASQTRNLIEGTLGFWYRFYSGPRGRFQFGTQYSYVTRNTWAGANNASPAVPGALEPHGIDNMVFTSFRYYLP